MRNITIKNVSKSYNGDNILNNISLKIPAGKFFALLGPSGCGKTTLLRLIGGFEKVETGQVFLGNTDITDMPINKRRINTVFQHYALFPHLNVFENVAYSLSIKNLPKEEIDYKTIKVIKTMHLESQMYKEISQLSGGQQQRVAIARAIVDEPEVLLLDEPLAALDFKLREKVLIELIELQDKLKTTFVYITHDQLEALTVADQMAIMNHHGKVEQIGTPKEIYEFPTSSFVARFVGNTNIFTGIVTRLELETEKEPKKGVIEDSCFNILIPNLGNFKILIPENKRYLVDNKSHVISLRPEKILISKEKKEFFDNFFTGIVEAIVYHGRSTQYNVRIENGNIIQVFEQNNKEVSSQEIIDYDNSVYLYWQAENIVLLER